MRAWTHSRTGTPSTVLTLSSTAPKPILTSSTDVLVRISHAALNPCSVVMMQFCPFFFRSKPAVPELDFSGTIVAAGSAVPKSRQLAPGAPVFGSVGIIPYVRTGAGALAEYITVAASAVVRKYGDTSFEEVAGLGVTGCTALVLLERAGLKKGDSVLVNGASGGVGTLAVQMAKEAVGESGRVVAVCSGRNVEMVGKLGADEVIDYQAHAPVSQHLASRYSKSRFNAVVDAYGVQDLYSHCANFLAPGKPFVSVGVASEENTASGVFRSLISMLKNELWPSVLGGVPRKYVSVNGIPNLEGMEKLARMVEEGKLRVVIDSCWKMEDGLRAYERILSKRAKGKVVVKVQDFSEI